MNHLLLGKDDFLKEEFIRSLREKSFPENPALCLNFQRFTAKKDSLASFLDFLNTLPFLEEKKIGVLNAVETLPVHEKEALLQFLGREGAPGERVFVSSESSVKKEPFLKELSEKCRVVLCHTPFERDLPSWIETRAKKRGKQISAQAVGVLIERAGRDLAGLDSALETICLFIHPRQRIESADAEKLLGKGLETDVFQWMDLVLDKKAVKAVSTVLNLLEQGVSAQELLGALTAQLERLKRIKAGLPVKLHPFFLEKVTAQARRVPEGEITALFEKLLRCDEAVKYGLLPDRVAIERFILETCVAGDLVLSRDGL